MSYNLREQENEKEKKSEVNKPNWNVRFRMLQFFFLAIFTLGISSMTGEYGAAANWPFSVFSIDSMLFGLIGVVISEVFARISQRWV